MFNWLHLTLHVSFFFIVMEITLVGLVAGGLFEVAAGCKTKELFALGNNVNV